MPSFFDLEPAARALRDSPRLAWAREWLDAPADSGRVAKAKRRLRAVWWVALIAVLAWGAKARFGIPQEPVIDPDIEGYLGPAISALSGHGFIHLVGRSFPYPAFVYGVLRVFGDFRAIAIAQHVLGLGAGVVILLAWNAAGRLTPAGGFPKPLYPFLGFVPALTYLGSQRMVLFEHQIRPEAIFPFLVILTIWVGFLFLEARFVRPNGRWLWLGALNVFLAVLLYETKPSFGFGVIFCTLPVWVSVFAPGRIWMRAALVAAAIFPALFLLVLPERALGRNDAEGKTFLPETLLTVHAVIIERQMAEDLAGGGPLPYPRPFLQGAHDLLKREIAKASKVTTPKAFVTLGTNPDYLMYRHSFCSQFMQENHLSREEMANFCMTYYKRALMHHPGAMAMKVLRQLVIVYQFKCPIYWVGPATNLSGDHYGRVAELIQHCASHGPNVPMLLRYVDNCKQLARENVQMVQSDAFTDWLHFLAPQYLLFFILAIASTVFVRREAQAHCFWLMAAVMLSYSCGLGNCLTVAIVHTLEVTRYVHIQLIYAVFAQSLGFYLLLELAAVRIRAGLGAVGGAPAAPAKN